MLCLCYLMRALSDISFYSLSFTSIINLFLFDALDVVERANKQSASKQLREKERNSKLCNVHMNACSCKKRQQRKTNRFFNRHYNSNTTAKNK